MNLTFNAVRAYSILPAVGDTFPTWNEFAEQYENFLKNTYHPIFVLKESRTAEVYNKYYPTTAVPVTCGYQKAVFVCVHGKKSKARIYKGNRPRQRIIKMNCTAKVTVIYSNKLKAFEITQCELRHVNEDNAQLHEINEQCFKKYNINIGFRALNYMIPRHIWQYDEAEKCKRLCFTKLKPGTLSTLQTAEALLKYDASLKKCKEFFQTEANVPISTKVLINKKIDLKKNRPHFRLLTLKGNMGKLYLNSYSNSANNLNFVGQEMTHSGSSVKISDPVSHVEVPHPESPVEMSHPESFVEMAHLENSVEMSHPVNSVEMSYTESAPEMSHPKSFVDLTDLENSVELFYPESPTEISTPEKCMKMPHPMRTAEHISQSHGCARYITRPIRKRKGYTLRYIIVDNLNSSKKAMLNHDKGRYSVVSVKALPAGTTTIVLDE